MKSYSRILGLLNVVVLALVAGCSKQESEPPPQPPPTPSAATEIQKAADSASAEVKNAADTATADAQRAAEKATADAQAQAAEAQAAAAKAATNAQADAASLTSRNQAMLDTVKRLLAEKKPAEALKVLGELATAKLTPEQQSMFANLKTQAQELLRTSATDKAAENIGGLLKNR